MTNIGHFRAASKVLDGKRDLPTRLWIAPPTKMDEILLNEEGVYGIFGKHRRPHGNARLLAVHGQPGADQEGQHGDVDLDPQLPQPPGHRHPGLPRFGRTGCGLRAAGPHPDGRRSTWSRCRPLRAKAADIYRYMNFDQIAEFSDVADTVTV
jgi:aconitate hydratase 2/2-methylisocitrate dehydratase